MLHNINLWTLACQRRHWAVLLPAVIPLLLLAVGPLLEPHFRTALQACTALSRGEEAPHPYFTRSSFTPRAQCEESPVDAGDLHVVLSYAGSGEPYRSWLPLMGLTNADIFVYHRTLPCRTCEGGYGGGGAGLPSARQARVTSEGGSGTAPAAAAAAAAAADSSSSGGGVPLACGMRLHVRLLLPNHGREGAAYLHHILQHYDALPRALLLMHNHGPHAWHMLPGPTVRRARAYYRGLAGDPWFTDMSTRVISLSSGCHRTFRPVTCCTAYDCELGNVEGSSACPLQQLSEAEVEQRQQQQDKQQQRQGGRRHRRQMLLQEQELLLQPGDDDGCSSRRSLMLSLRDVHAAKLPSCVYKEGVNTTLPLADLLAAYDFTTPDTWWRAARRAYVKRVSELPTKRCAAAFVSPAAGDGAPPGAAEAEACGRALADANLTDVTPGGYWSCCLSMGVPRVSILKQRREVYEGLLAVLVNTSLDDQLTGRMCLEFVSYKLFDVGNLPDRPEVYLRVDELLRDL